MIFRGPGGHSFQEFGLPSAIHAMGRLIGRIADLETPAEPKTTFTVGTVRGGTSVNTIAGDAHMTVDLRSNATEELLKLKTRVLALVNEAAAEENKRWGSDRITVEINLIGERPAGMVAEDSPLVEAARRSATAIARGLTSCSRGRALTLTWPCCSVSRRSPSAAAAKAATGIRSTNGTSRQMPISGRRTRSSPC
jgi:acetylornithine deacetylase/succinyl-diaminopimelate desuccinylase-like protein